MDPKLFTVDFKTRVVRILRIKTIEEISAKFYFYYISAKSENLLLFNYNNLIPYILRYNMNKIHEIKLELQ